MAEHDNLIVSFSEGRGNLGKAKPRTEGWAKFCDRHSKPTRTKELRKAFDKMSKEEQDELKSIDGWEIGAQLKDGVRRRQNIRPRDYALPEFLTLIEMGLLPISEFEFFVHSTRRHTSEKPRIRLFMPLASKVAADDYPAISRIFAFRAEGVQPMTQDDPVSFRPAQLMFKPTASANGEFWSFRNEGAVFDPKTDAADWFRAQGGDPEDYSNLPKCESEDELRKSADKAEDPTSKKGPVGDWCRAYDVFAAIDKFLPDCYAPTGEASNKPRYTYLKGTSTSGAVVEDDGLFLYSHHGSDPCADMLVNSFDLVRIHKFGDLDEDKDLKDVMPTKWPSYKAMIEFAAADDGFRKSRIESRYGALMASFEDISDPDEPEDEETAESDDTLDDDVESVMGDFSARGSGSPGDGPETPKTDKAAKPKTKRPKKEKPAKDWVTEELSLDEKGAIQSSAPNAAIIIHNDPRLWGRIAFNGFTRQIVCLKSIKPNIPICPPFVCHDTTNGERWQDFNDIILRLMLEAPNAEGQGYGLRISDRDLNAAVVSAARRNEFHPIREYLETLEWDGESRVDSLFADYLGVEDNPYHREAARWTLLASVARIFEPGHKFDYAPIIQGPTGIRKSSFIKALYSPAWFGELHCKLDDQQQVAETIGDMWDGELPELTGFHKSDFNAAKAFMRRQHDDVRMAYDRRVTEFPRQAVFWGTTNDSKYLKDPTGNRSYWPVICGEDLTAIDTNRLARERDQIWAEAVALYRVMRENQPAGDLPLTLTDPIAQQIALSLQEGARTMDMHELWALEINDWLETPIHRSQFLAELTGDRSYRAFAEDDDDPMVVRCVYSLKQAVEFVLKKDRGVADTQTSSNIQKAMELVSGWHAPRKDGIKGIVQTKVNGHPYRVWLRDVATRDEINAGYRVLPAADDDWRTLI